MSHTLPSPLPSRRRFTVGFSYAGEDRSLLEPIAQRLADRLTEARVLFDRFHEAELARVDLDVYLPRLYRDHTELIVIVLSTDYPKKRWCGLEWRWIRQLILSEAQGRIMPLGIGNPGDLSELGILSGDGFLDISQRSADAIAEKILERLLLQGVSIDGPDETSHGLQLRQAKKIPLDVHARGQRNEPSLSAALPFQPQPPQPRKEIRLAALAAGAVTLLIGSWWVGRPLLARWQLQQGDRAFLDYVKLLDERNLQTAGRAWKQARALDPNQAEAHARLGFLADILNDLPAAASHWRQAATLTSQNTPQAQALRNGLANVLAQQPGQQQAALAIYDADRFYPRSAVEAALQRWPKSEQMPQALDAISERTLDTALSGDRPAPNPWGFKENGALLLFERHAHQRCLLANVRAATRHLAGVTLTSEPPLTISDCLGVSEAVKELLCTRLSGARSNPRVHSTARWLECPRQPRGGLVQQSPNTG